MDENQVSELRRQSNGFGLLVLAPPLRILHADQRAVEFMRQLRAFEHPETDGPSANGFLPAPLLQLSAELFRVTQDRANMKNVDQFEARYTITTPTERVRIRMFGLPDHRERSQARLVILLEEIGDSDEEAGRAADQPGKK